MLKLLTDIALQRDLVPEVLETLDNETAPRALCTLRGIGGASEEEIQEGAVDVCPVSCISWRSDAEYLKSFGSIG